MLVTSAASEDLHSRSVLLDTLADVASAMAIAIAGLVITLTGRSRWLDPVLALAVAAVVAAPATGLSVRAIGSARGNAADFMDD